MERKYRWAVVILGGAVAVAGLIARKSQASTDGEDRPRTLPPDREPGEWRSHLRRGGRDA